MADIDRHKLYSDFLEAFPLESLKDMPLEKYSNLNKVDSFCYWVEFLTLHLGSIRGGSSYKFGIYKYNNQPSNNPRIVYDSVYAWYSRYGKSTAEEAYELVRNAIINIALHARKGEFEEIENINVVDNGFKWKIAFLYSEKSFVPIYKKEMLNAAAAYFGMTDPESHTFTEIQRFLMSKKGDEDLFVFYEKILEIIKNQDSSRKKWVYGPGENGSMWERCIKNDEICIGWDDIDDLSQYTTKSEYMNLLREMNDDPKKSFKNDRLCLYEFTHVMNPGDIVYARKGLNKVIGRAIVESEYIFNDVYETYRHIHKVRWTHIGEWDAPWQFTQKTLTEISKYGEEAEELEALFIDEKPQSPSYWWLLSNPKIWSFNNINAGEKLDYTLYNENGHKRRIFQNFLDAKAGDIIIGYESSPSKQVVALAKVLNDSDEKVLEFAKTETLLNPISLGYLKEIPELQEMEYLKNPQGSLFKLTENEYNIIMDVIREENPIQKNVASAVYTDKDFLNEVFMSSKEFETLKHLLVSKKNIILQGAPGVGKTFSAKRLCYALMGEKDDSRIEFVQFHQNYSYEDFIMGYKPTQDGGFSLKCGIFYNFCKRAKNELDPNKKYFFIIDEINRGNMSKIFGELMMLIEKDYRGDKHAIKLAYNDELFSVPENVYIIGMMNTADRSLAMIDYALRRRFSFFDMKPGFESEGFVKYQQTFNNNEFNKLIDAVKHLNEQIFKDDSLGAGFCIGHSYFCNQSEISQMWLKNVVEYDIVPMLREYWFDNNTTFEAESQKLMMSIS